MAKYGSDKAQLALINGYDILSSLTSWTDKREAKIEETHTLGDSWVEQTYTGVRSAEWTQEGFYDDGVNSAHEALSANLSTSKVLVFGVEGNTTGKEFVGFTGALQIDYERIVSRGELHKAKATYKGNGQVDQGKILHPLQGRTASGNTTAGAIDFGTSNVSGGAGYFQLTSFSSGAGTTALLAKIMDSPDNLTFTSRMAFTAASAAPLAERKSTTVAWQRYAAVKWSGASGDGAPASCIFFVGLARY